ncbi:nitroreductase family protein [Candidatus Roizmanbacteria bacterium]|nr:nitroreductase family protein [Candidatus Roizmanbacteria bacterium]
MLDAILKRRSCRKYKSNDVNDALLDEILKAAQYAPTAKNWRGWEFVVVRDKQIQRHIAEVVHERFGLSAPIFLFPIIDMSTSVCPIEELSTVTTHIMLQAKDCGLDSIWIEIIESKEDKIKTILNIPDNYLLINLIQIGYCDEELRPHTESEFDENKIHFDNYTSH